MVPKIAVDARRSMPGARSADALFPEPLFPEPRFSAGRFARLALRAVCFLVAATQAPVRVRMAPAHSDRPRHLQIGPRRRHGSLDALRG
jgi:hypothetical protein